MIRATGRATMRFWQGEWKTVRVRWFRAAPGAQFLGIPTCFTSNVWLRDKPENVAQQNRGSVGEVSWKGDKPQPGRDPVGYLGQDYCGSPQAWLAGGVRGVTPEILTRADGSAPCCGALAVTPLGGLALGGFGPEVASTDEIGFGGLALGGTGLEVTVVVTDRLSALVAAVQQVNAPGTLPAVGDQAFSVVDQLGGGPYTVSLGSSPNGTLLWVTGDPTLGAVVTLQGSASGLVYIGDATSIAITAYSSVELFKVSSTQWVVISEARRPGDGSVVPDSAGYVLVGDLLAPGGSRLYGTDPAGVKGWYPLAAIGFGCVFAQTTTVTVSNTIAQVSLVGTGVGSLVIPANTLVSGTTYRMQAGGSFAMGASGGLNALVLVGTSASFVGAGGNDFTTSAGGTYWRMNIVFTCRSAGALGLIQGAGAFEIFDLADSPVSYYTLNLGVTAVEGIDTTVDNTVDLQIQFAIANINNKINCGVLELERLR